MDYSTFCKEFSVKTRLGLYIMQFINQNYTMKYVITPQRKGTMYLPRRQDAISAKKIPHAMILQEVKF